MRWCNRTCAHHLNDDWLRDGHDHDVIQVQIGILRLRPGPRGKRADNFLTEQRHEVIAFAEDHDAWRRPDPANDVQYRVRVASERLNTGLPDDDRPNKAVQLSVLLPSGP